MLCVYFVADVNMEEQVTPMGQEEKEVCSVRECDNFVLVNWLRTKLMLRCCLSLKFHFLCLTILQDTTVIGWLCSVVKTM